MRRAPHPAPLGPGPGGSRRGSAPSPPPVARPRARARASSPSTSGRECPSHRSVGRDSPTAARRAVRRGGLGLLRASDITPAVRALALDDEGDFRVYAIETLGHAWFVRMAGMKFRLRFSVRTLVIFITLICVCIGAWEATKRHVENDRRLAPDTYGWATAEIAPLLFCRHVLDPYAKGARVLMWDDGPSITPTTRYYLWLCFVEVQLPIERQDSGKFQFAGRRSRMDYKKALDAVEKKTGWKRHQTP